MVEYGYLDENGIMTSKIIREYTEYYKDENGELKERTISVEDQAEQLKNNGWKPVDGIDENQMNSGNGYSVNLVAYDAGERISYRYEKFFDKRELQDKIQELKKQLLGSDYKIIKCYEADLLKGELPYDIEVLSEQRQAVRDKINDLESELQQTISK